MSSANISDARCMLVVGATAGLGRKLAIALHGLPSEPTVIVAGHRQDRLDALSGVHERMEDVGGYLQVVLDAVVFSAGVQRVFDFQKPEALDLDAFDVEVTTNYTSIVTVTFLLLPHFLKLSTAGHYCFISPISSALGMCPAPFVPNYSATKAAMHSFVLSFDSQLKDTNIHGDHCPALIPLQLHTMASADVRFTDWLTLSFMTVFTPLAIQGLQRGDMQIVIGGDSRIWEKFEKDKVAAVAETKERTRALRTAIQITKDV